MWRGHVHQVPAGDQPRRDAGKFEADAIVAAAEGLGPRDVGRTSTPATSASTRRCGRARIEAALSRPSRPTRASTYRPSCSASRSCATSPLDAERFADGHGRRYVSLLGRSRPPSRSRPSRQPGRRAVAGSAAGPCTCWARTTEAKLTNAAIEKHLGVATNRNLTVIEEARRWAAGEPTAPEVVNSLVVPFSGGTAVPRHAVAPCHHRRRSHRRGALAADGFTTPSLRCEFDPAARAKPGAPDRAGHHRPARQRPGTTRTRWSSTTIRAPARVRRHQARPRRHADQGDAQGAQRASRS